MIRRFSSIAIVAILLLLSIFVINVSAYNISISPDHFDFSGSKGNNILKTAIITNHNTTAVRINITTNASGLSIIPASFILNASSSKNILITYVLPVNISSGLINFSWNKTNLSVTVKYIEDKTEQAPVEIFPDPPLSGTDIAIFFTGTSRGLTARGFLSVNGFIYPVEIDGFGIISLNKDAYGTATLYLFGNSIKQADSRKIFNITKGSSKLAGISIAKEAVFDSDIKVTVTYGDDAIGNIDVAVENPDGDKDTYETDNRGIIEFTADALGKWKVSANIEGQMVTGSINIVYGNLVIGIAEETYTVGDTVTVATDPDATIDVYVDNDYKTQLVASSDGLVSLALTDGGNYRLVGSLENLRGEYTFSLPKQAQIMILDASTRMQVMNIVSGKRYVVQVTDGTGNVITDVEELWISNPMGTKELLTLSEGEGPWTPLTTGAYSLSVDDTSTAAGNSKYMFIRSPESELGLVPTILAVIIIFVVIIIILWLSARSKHMTVGMLIGSMFKRKKRLEIPVDGR